MLLELTDLFELSRAESTRGNALKLQVHSARLDIQKYFFSNRVVRVWNDLLDNIINAPSITSFKSKVQQINLKKFLRGWALEPQSGSASPCQCLVLH